MPVIDQRTGKQKIEKKTGRRVWAREVVQANDWNDRARAESWRESWARAETISRLQKLSNIPEVQNDMIFSIICEELGLFGAIVVLLMFGYLCYRLMVIAENAS